MNKEEILGATNTQLNEWTATKVMGWKNGGEGWWVDRGITTQHTIAMFHPTRSLVQAFQVLTHLRNTHQVNWEVTTFSPAASFMVVVHYPNHDSVPQVVVCSDDSLPRAITIACLLAVVAMEEPHAE